MNQELTTIFKDIIRKNGLVNTGRLLNSIKVFTSVSNNQLISIDIRGVEYLYAVAYNNDLTRQFEDDLRTSDAVTAVAQIDIERQIERYLNDGEAIKLDYKIVITYNGL